MVPETQTDGSVSGVLVAVRDFTARKRAEEALAFQAGHDPLTGLANRTLFIDRLSQALLRTERGSGLVGMLFVDLDRFKAVNDSLGHAAGDWFLHPGRAAGTGLRPATGHGRPVRWRRVRGAVRGPVRATPTSARSPPA